MKRTQRLTILSDMDCIAVDLLGPWLKTYNIENGTSFTVEDLTEWDLAKLIGPKFQEVIDRPGFFRTLGAVDGAAEALRSLLEENHEVYFITAASQHAASDKIFWMREFMPFMDGRMFIAQGKTPKHILEADVLIDDAAHNIEAFGGRRPGSLRLGISYPYNEKAKDGLFFEGWRTPRHAWAQILAAVRGYAQAFP